MLNMGDFDYDGDDFGFEDSWIYVEDGVNAAVSIYTLFPPEQQLVVHLGEACATYMYRSLGND